MITLLFVFALPANALLLVRDNDPISDIAARATVEAPPQDAQVLSSEDVAHAFGVAAILAETDDDSAARKRFKAERENAKNSTDKALAKTLLRNALEEAKALSLLQLEYRQTAIMTVEQDLAKLLASTEPKGAELEQLLIDMAIRAQFAGAPALPSSLQRRYYEVAEKQKRSKTTLLEMEAEGSGEISVDGGPFRPLLPRDSVKLTPGTHELFVRWQHGSGWTRTVTVIAKQALPLVRFDGELERMIQVTKNGLRYRGGMTEREAALLTALVKADELWFFEQRVPQRITACAYRDKTLRRTVIDTTAEPPKSVLLAALAAARLGGAPIAVPGFKTRPLESGGFAYERLAPEAQAKPIYKQWWFWTIVGGAAAVAIVATTAGVVAAQNSADTRMQLSVRF